MFGQARWSQRSWGKALAALALLAPLACSATRPMADVPARGFDAGYDNGGGDCTPGQDQTCNDNPMLSSLHGTCRPDRLCECRPEFLKNPETGRCL